MRPSVGRVEHHVVPQPSLKQSLQSVVVSISLMSPPRQKAVVSVWPQGIAIAQEGACVPTTLWDLIDVGCGQLMSRPIADVGEFQARFLPDALLNGNVPLEGIRRRIGRVQSAGG